MKHAFPNSARLAGLAAALAMMVALPPAVGAASVRVSTDRRQAPPALELRTSDDAVLLTLDEAVEIALRRNLSIVVERANRMEAEQRVLENRGIYDLFGTANLKHLDAKQATSSRLAASQLLEDDFNVGLQQLVATGATVAFSWQNSRQDSNLSFNSINPAYSASPGFLFRQPLLRDLGRLATDHNILVARLTSDIGRDAFVLQVIATVQQVENGYWNLVAARAQLRVAQQALDLANELHHQNKIRVDVGTLAPLELVQSEVGIAEREEDIIRAQAAIGNAADTLRRLLNVPQGDLWTKDIVPETPAETERIPLDLAGALASALQDRPELDRGRKSIDSKRIDASYFHNQLLPRLDLTARYGLSGVDANYPDALRQVTDFGFPSWSVELALAIPLQNRTARAQKTIADLEYEKAQDTLKDAELQVTTEVRTALRAVDTSAKQIDSARSSRSLAERNLDAEKKRYENGLSTSFQVLQIQQDLSAARSREVDAISGYRQALVEYYRALGRLLPESHVDLADEAAE